MQLRTRQGILIVGGFNLGPHGFGLKTPPLEGAMRKLLEQFPTTKRPAETDPRVFHPGEACSATPVVFILPPEDMKKAA